MVDIATSLAATKHTDSDPPPRSTNKETTATSRSLTGNIPFVSLDGFRNANPASEGGESAVVWDLASGVKVAENPVHRADRPSSDRPSSEPAAGRGPGGGRGGGRGPGLGRESTLATAGRYVAVPDWGGHDVELLAATSGVHVGNLPLLTEGRRVRTLLSAPEGRRLVTVEEVRSAGPGVGGGGRSARSRSRSRSAAPRGSATAGGSARCSAAGRRKLSIAALSPAEPT